MLSFVGSTRTANKVLSFVGSTRTATDGEDIRQEGATGEEPLDRRGEGGEGRGGERCCMLDEDGWRGAYVRGLKLRTREEI